MCAVDRIMRCNVATTAVLAVLLFASAIVAEDTPYDGIRGLQTLPSTDNGQLLGACFNELLKSYGTGDKMLYDIRVNKTIAPIDVRLDGQFAEQVSPRAAAQMLRHA